MRKLRIGRLANAGAAVCLALSLASVFAWPQRALAQASEPRLALVIGNGDYSAGPLATAANDAGLVADSLRAIGFEVNGAANLDQEALRRAFRDFLSQAAQAGPQAIIFVYLSGRGLQYEGENYFAPIDAVIARESDIPIEALRVSDFTRALAALPLKARIVVLDAARANNFARTGEALAGGLALVDAENGALYAFNAAPGAIAPDEPPPYGAYAKALAEMLRAPSLPIEEIFARARLRVDQATQGAFAPFDVSKIDPAIVLIAGAPATPVAGPSYSALRARPIGEFPSSEAYAAAVERDTLSGYEEFLAAYPNDRLAIRVRALLAARREAVTWRRAVLENTPGAYWTYMRRYPRGPHFWDARRRLALLAAPLEPPQRFDLYDFGGLPPPPPVEYEIVDRPVLVFDPGLYPPPPPPPVYFLPPQPVVFVAPPPPPPPASPGFLPVPIPIPIPVQVGRPNPPPGVLIQQNFGQQRAGSAGVGQGAIPPRNGGPIPAQAVVPAPARGAARAPVQGAVQAPLQPAPRAAAPAGSAIQNPHAPGTAQTPAVAPTGRALPQGLQLPPSDPAKAAAPEGPAHNPASANNPQPTPGTAAAPAPNRIAPHGGAGHAPQMGADVPPAAGHRLPGPEGPAGSITPPAGSRHRPPAAPPPTPKPIAASPSASPSPVQHKIEPILPHGNVLPAPANAPQPPGANAPHGPPPAQAHPPAPPPPPAAQLHVQPPAPHPAGGQQAGGPPPQPKPVAAKAPPTPNRSGRQKPEEERGHQP